MRKGSKNREKVRSLRKNMSISERRLWDAVRKNKLGFSFRRQLPVGPYALDFYCAEAALCIEVDGEQHADREVRDTARDEYMTERGVHTLRIPSLDLFDPNGVAMARWLREIARLCEERSGRAAWRQRKTSIPQPPSSKSERLEEGG
ncbi:MAG: DUF559 domain-containing protein [Armatimonadetes bacterium]|nr:DUF559 domain-containing protein [Armatimonadota bacterium]